MDYVNWKLLNKKNKFKLLKISARSHPWNFLKHLEMVSNLPYDFFKASLPRT